MVLPVLHISRFEEGGDKSQDFSVCNTTGYGFQETAVWDVIEATYDVAFDYP
jgi:hypothetical protein